ncbi:MAG: YicC family protein [Caldimicrobium sp.]|nr:YicC family protein [Caldimicrobium sp.]MCX7613128.1 YicC family protein [Caldimicrobium sp.]MDW8183265.1 YicC/YloC family endoribonuclease [Caldimicrobium sp.]
MESMTGFGKGVSVGENFQILCQIKSLNHRFLDISLKIPKRYQALEERIRRKLGEVFIRGKLELSIKILGFTKDRGRIIFDQEMVRDLKERLDSLKKGLSLTGDITLADLLHFKDWILIEEREEDVEQLWEEIKEALEKAIGDLKRARLEEGERLKVLLKDLVEKLKELASRLTPLKEETRRENLQRMQERVEKLMKELRITLDDNRLYQEIAFLIERMDFTEELDRFKIHLETMENLLEELNSGKKLDFLCQELYREINTLASKAQSAKVSSLAVEAKDIIEKMREQVQNIL